MRSFVTDDLFNFNHVNLDLLTETVSTTGRGAVRGTFRARNPPVRFWVFEGSACADSFASFPSCPVSG